MSKNCLVCDRLVECTMLGPLSTIDECYHIYNQCNLVKDGVTLLSRLNDVLGADMNSSIWHSDIICKDCFQLIQQMDILEQRIIQLCIFIRTEFVNTAAKYNILVAVSDVIPSMFGETRILRPEMASKAVGPDVPYLVPPCPLCMRSQKRRVKDEKCDNGHMSEEGEPEIIECEPDSEAYRVPSQQQQKQQQQQQQQQQLQQSQPQALQQQPSLPPPPPPPVQPQPPPQQTTLISSQQLLPVATFKETRIHEMTAPPQTLFKQEPPTQNDREWLPPSEKPERLKTEKKKKVKEKAETRRTEHQSSSSEKMRSKKEKKAKKRKKVETEEQPQQQQKQQPASQQQQQFFNCILCGLGHMTAEELNVHMNEHDQKDKPFKCPVCCITFGYQETLDVHMKKHKMDEVNAAVGITMSGDAIWITSEECLNGTATLAQVPDAKVISAELPKFLCSLCGWVGEDMLECTTHFAVHETLICTACCSTIHDVNTLKQHNELCRQQTIELEGDSGEESEVETDSLVCKWCGEKSLDAEAHKTHLQTHRKFDCDLCDAKFYRKYHLARHQMNQHGMQKKCKSSKPVAPLVYRGPKVECPVCGLILSRKDHLKRHIKNIHDNPSSVKRRGRRPSMEAQEKKCNICGLELSSTSNLRQHMVIHSDQHPFGCSLCGRRFKLQKYLDLHMMLHRGEKKHVCPDCGKSYAHKTGFNRHRRSHTGEKPHICEFCGQTFAHLGGLKSHRLIHTGERPHRCEECGYGARTFMKLQIHKRKHTGEKPYHCEYCGKNFAYKYNFDAHLRIHRGEKRFICQVCQRAFDRRSKYSEHMESHGVVVATTTAQTTVEATTTTTVEATTVAVAPPTPIHTVTPTSYLLSPQTTTTIPYLPQMITCPTDMHFLSAVGQ